MADLFDASDEAQAKRSRLRARGCFLAGGYSVPLHWRLPNGAVVSEDEAFAWLARQPERKADEE